MINGGPAFPVERSFDEEGESDKQTGNRSFLHPGMTLRDYFAAKALQGLIASNESTTFERDGENAYKWADAMLRARQEAAK